jgi:hypothetical protein
MRHQLIKRVHRTCVAYPEQYEGILTTGQCFYFRLRHGEASLGLGRMPHEAVVDPETVIRRVNDHGMGRFITDQQRDATFAEMLTERLAVTEGGDD